MNWQQLNQNEKNKTMITFAILLAVGIYFFVFSPMYQRSNTLQLQLESEQGLANYLNSTKQQLALLPTHPTLTKQQAQKIIESLSKANKIKLNALIMQTNSSSISINKIEFNKLLNFLQQFKSKHGMVATEADIKRIDIGIVSAYFTLQYP